MGVIIYQPDGSVKTIKDTRTPEEREAQRALIRERIAKHHEGNGEYASVRRLRETLDRLDAERAEFNRKTAEDRERRKDKGSNIDLIWLLCFPLSLFW